MQNSLNKESTVVEFTSKSAADAKKGMTAPSELVSQVSKIGMQETQKPAQITPLKARAISVIKKDGTSEPFDSTMVCRNGGNQSTSDIWIDSNDSLW